jgi:hypothetical protein
MTYDAEESAVPIRVRERQRVVADIGIAVPALRAFRLAHHRIGTGKARDQRIVDAAVVVNERDVGELFLAGIAARDGAGDAAC